MNLNFKIKAGKRGLNKKMKKPQKTKWRKQAKPYLEIIDPSLNALIKKIKSKDLLLF